MSKRFYSYPNDTKAIAFIDIIGFSALTKKFSTDSNLAQLVFVSHENCILNYRSSMKTTAGFSREVPANLNDPGHLNGFWYKEVPEASVNFIYLSDSVVMYSSSLSHLLRELSAIFGAAIVWGVPMRAVVTMGDLEHSEWIERPGAAICLYGSALTKAAEIEKSKSGKGMRVWMDNDVTKLALSIDTLKDLVLELPPEPTGHAELKWWLGALQGTQGRSESEELRMRYDKWYTEKHPKDWFGGPNKTDTDKVIDNAVADLKSLKR